MRQHDLGVLQKPETPPLTRTNFSLKSESCANDEDGDFSFLPNSLCVLTEGAERSRALLCDAQGESWSPAKSRVTVAVSATSSETFHWNNRLPRKADFTVKTHVQGRKWPS